MRSKCVKGLVLGTFLTIVGCSSNPTWEGMSESEISQWRAIGAGAGQAQSWSREGFNAEKTKEWKTAGFDLESAREWSNESYTAAEAKRWKDSGFDIDEANDARKKGLTPVRAGGSSLMKVPVPVTKAVKSSEKSSAGKPVQKSNEANKTVEKK